MLQCCPCLSDCQLLYRDVSMIVGALRLRKNWGSHIDASHSRQPLVKGERLVRHEVNAVMTNRWSRTKLLLTIRLSGSCYVSQWYVGLLPQRVCCSQRCAMPVQHAKVSEQAQENTSPGKNRCDKQVSSWRHISCHTDKNRYYT